MTNGKKKCEFTAKYDDDESQEEIDYKCLDDEEIPDSGLCMFHDERYLQGKDKQNQGKDKHKEHKVRNGLNAKIHQSQSVDQKQPLFCIGYHLPDITIKGKFTNPVYFSKCNFQGEADFSGAIFQEKAVFSESEFFAEANFSRGSPFNEENIDEFQYKFHGIDTESPSERQMTELRAFFEDKSFGPKFFREANFSSAKFFRDANFLDAKFQGEANFGESTFSGEAKFTLAKFRQSASFWNSKLAKADFWKAKFFEAAEFFLTNFGETGSFQEVEFFGIANFWLSKFSGEARFRGCKFSREANFSEAEFQGEADFSCEFNGETYFNYVLFEDGKKILFNTEDLSKVSFANTDITRVRFIETARWGEGKKDEDRFKVIEEKMLDNSSDYYESLKYLLNLRDTIKEDESRQINFNDNKNLLQIKLGKRENAKENIAIVRNINDNTEFKFVIKKIKDKLEAYPQLQISLGSVMAIYRNLRENYEFRLRYDEAGKFFIREMELKRNYREKLSPDGSKTIIKRNGLLRRNLSLTGLYYRLSRYGENLLRPTLVGIAIVFGSTLFWLIQNNPTAEPSLSVVSKHSSHMSNFINMTYLSVWNNTHVLKAFERSFSDFLPLLPQGSDVKVGIFDFIIKIVGGALTFGLLAVALRRRRR